MHPRGARVHPSAGHQEWLEYAAEAALRYKAVTAPAPSTSALQAKYETVRAKLLLQRETEPEPQRFGRLWTAADSAQNWSLLARKLAQMHGISLGTWTDGQACCVSGAGRLDVGRDQRKPLYPSKAANANVAAPPRPQITMLGSYVPPRRTLASCVGSSGLYIAQRAVQPSSAQRLGTAVRQR
jgi:hypothetical protein